MKGGVCMNGGEKILNRIKADSDVTIKQIENDANNTCSKILADAKIEAEKSADAIIEKAKAKALQINASSKSRAELEMRNALLKKRRQEIDFTLDKILEYMLSLDNGSYFELIYKLCSKLEATDGEILFNNKDLKRLPSDFSKKVAQLGLNVRIGGLPVNICGGFILKHGDIEENMDFSALLSEKRDEIEDLINRELFTQ